MPTTCLSGSATPDLIEPESDNVVNIRRILELVEGYGEMPEGMALVTLVGKVQNHKLVVVGKEMLGDLVLEEAGLLEVLKIVQKAQRSGNKIFLDRVESSKLRFRDVEYVVAEIVEPKLSLVIFGAGHVGQATALMGVLLGYEVTVIDDRIEFLSRVRFPDERIRLVASDYSEVDSKITWTGRSAAIIVTRGHQYDEVCLKQVINSRAKYVGMIGSRRRVLSIFSRLEQEGISKEALSRVHAPIGLRIGARSPQEIAVSILSEIIQTFNEA